MSLGQQYEIQEGKVPGPTFQPQQHPTVLQAEGSVAEKQLRRKGPAGVTEIAGKTKTLQHF